MKRKTKYLRCRQDEFMTQNWPEMERHLADKHNLNPGSADKAGRQGMIRFTNSPKPNKIRIPFRLRDGKQKRPKKGRAGKRTVKASVTMQELVVPIYVRIPFAIGTISIKEYTE